MKLSITLLLILALISAFGTLIPQQEGAMDLAERWSPSLYSFLNSLQFFDLYHSLWFRLIIAGLALNLTVCSLDRLPSSLKRFRHAHRPERTRLFEDLPQDRICATKGNPDHAADQVAGLLHAAYKKVETSKTDKGHFFYVEKGRYSYFGVYVVHFSVLLILIGGVLGSLMGFEAFMNIPEGESVNEVIVEKSHKHKDLPFSVHLKKFHVDFYQDGTPKEYRSDLSFLMESKMILEGALRVNHPITFQGITFYQSSYGTVPGNSVRLTIKRDGNDEMKYMEVEPKKVYPLADGSQFVVGDIQADFMRMGPAVQIRIKPREGEEILFWVLKEREKIRQRFPGIFEQFPKLNPETYKPYHFFLDAMETRYYTGLQVNKDPGVPFVYAGFSLMIIGLYLAFFTSHRMIWIQVAKEDAKGVVKIKVSGRANKNPAGLDREILQLTQKIRERMGEKRIEGA